MSGGLQLPTGTRLLHIGPQKTGTTAVQGAFHSSRAALAEHGVHYAGEGRQPRPAAAAVVLGEALPGYPADSVERWPRLVDEVRSSTADQVVISAEMFANADVETARKIVHAFGPQTHVVVTLRPLAKILPSQWQQYVQSGAWVSYGEWLEAMLNHPADSTDVTPGFWHRHRHDELVARWADIVGKDRLTVIAIGESDRRMLLDTFEHLLGLPAGLLTYDARNNSSLSLTETEIYREFNREFFLEQGWPVDVHAEVARYGMATYLKRQRPTSLERPIVTPAWAIRRADDIAVDVIEGIGRAEVEVIGDPQDLRYVPTDAPPAAEDLAEVPVEIAARAVMGVIRHTTTAPVPKSRRPSAADTDEMPATADRGPGGDAEVARGPAVEDVPAADLLAMVAARARHRLRPTRSPR